MKKVVTMESGQLNPVLLTGATGFVGRQLYPLLAERGYNVVCATRDVERAESEHPDREWVELDVEQPATIDKALDRVNSAFYLIHQMAGDLDYASRERRSARRFRDAASSHDLSRLVYLGGVAPKGRPSEHIQSRLTTGRVLRSGGVSTIELRASMIIGTESASWQIVRDLAARLPAMVLPNWTRSQTQPVWIGDVVDALVGALALDETSSMWFDIPGPETMTIEEILRRTANVMGREIPAVNVPFLTPRLSSWWLQFVTSADMRVARQLVEGLKSDLLAEHDEFWERIGKSELLGFDEAAERSLEPSPTRSGRIVEGMVRRFSRRKT